MERNKIENEREEESPSSTFDRFLYFALLPRVSSPIYERLEQAY